MMIIILDRHVDKTEDSVQQYSVAVYTEVQSMCKACVMGKFTLCLDKKQTTWR